MMITASTPEDYFRILDTIHEQEQQVFAERVGRDYAREIVSNLLQWAWKDTPQRQPSAEGARYWLMHLVSHYVALARQLGYTDLAALLEPVAPPPGEPGENKKDCAKRIIVALAHPTPAAMEGAGQKIAALIALDDTNLSWLITAKVTDFSLRVYVADSLEVGEYVEQQGGLALLVIQYAQALTRRGVHKNALMAVYNVMNMIKDDVTFPGPEQPPEGEFYA